MAPERGGQTADAATAGHRSAGATAEAAPRVVLAAAAANLAIAVTKGLAGLYTGSGAMLTEAVHSLVDTANEGLLLLGVRLGRRPADAAHPFGHGREVYFWAFVVALVVFVGGGVASIIEGVLKILAPHPLRRVWIDFSVLAAAFLFESISLGLGLRGLRRRGGEGSVVRRIVRSKDPSLYATVLEDSAALVGLVFAASGTAAATWAGWAWADGAASVGIGLLLMSAAVFLGRETRSLLTGEAAALGVRAALECAAHGEPDVVVAEVITLQLGPDDILAAYQIAPEQPETAATWPALRRLAGAARAADPRIRRVFFAPGDPGRAGAERRAE